MKTAIEQAKSMFDRLVNLKINKAPLPIGQERVFAVATLPNGMVAMSDGTQKMSFPQKKISDLQKTEYDQLINQDKIEEQQKNMTLGVALPESQLNQPGQPGVDLAGFLGKFLTPQLQSSPEAQITALMPTVANDQEFQRTSALSMLPEVTPERKALFNDGDFSKRFLQEGKNVQEELMKEFLSQINRGESAVESVSKFNMPIVSNYDNRYTLPNAGNPQAATIGTSVNQLTDYIK